jgi:hypothetical protein
MKETKLETFLPARVVSALRARASQEGRGVEDLLKDAVLEYLNRRRYMGDNSFSELMYRTTGRAWNEFSEEEALNLANEELHKYRRER